MGKHKKSDESSGRNGIFYKPGRHQDSKDYSKRKDGVIEKMQRPDPWPDPPLDENDNKKKGK
jgi:hypothetical protein